MTEGPYQDQVNEGGALFIVLMEYCPRCGTRLFINEGVNGKVYWCPKENMVVTQNVIRAHKQSLEPASSETAREFKVEFPSELQKFSWAAFLFNWIWAFARGLHTWGIGILLTQVLIAIMVPIAILVLPLMGLGALVFYIWFGFAANRLDWQKNNYRTADEFRRSHRRWQVFTIIFGIFLLLSSISTGIILGINLST